MVALVASMTGRKEMFRSYEHKRAWVFWTMFEFMSWAAARRRCG